MPRKIIRYKAVKKGSDGDYQSIWIGRKETEGLGLTYRVGEWTFDVPDGLGITVFKTLQDAYDFLNESSMIIAMDYRCEKIKVIPCQCIGHIPRKFLPSLSLLAICYYYRDRAKYNKTVKAWPWSGAQHTPSGTMFYKAVKLLEETP